MSYSYFLRSVYFKLLEIKCGRIFNTNRNSLLILSYMFLRFIIFICLHILYYISKLHMQTCVCAHAHAHTFMYPPTCLCTSHASPTNKHACADTCACTHAHALTHTDTHYFYYSSSLTLFSRYTKLYLSIFLNYTSKLAFTTKKYDYRTTISCQLVFHI